MTDQEAIKLIRRAIAEIEWEQPMEYAAAFDRAIEALELRKDSIIPVRCYECIHRGSSRCPLYNDYNDYYTSNPGLVSDWFCADGERR